MNAVEIMLDVLNYVQGELFVGAKVSKIAGADNDSAFVELELANKDKITFEFGYTKNSGGEESAG